MSLDSRPQTHLASYAAAVYTQDLNRYDQWRQRNPVRLSTESIIQQGKLISLGN